MNNTTSDKQTGKTEADAKGGFFKRIIGRIDRTMKDKAERAAAKGGCCCNDGKDGKCS